MCYHTEKRKLNFRRSFTRIIRIELHHQLSSQSEHKISVKKLPPDSIKIYK